MACAWATFFCYGTMMVLSYKWGQKAYRIPYAWKKLMAYIIIVVLIYFAHFGLNMLWDNNWFNMGTATALLLSFAWLIVKVERQELMKIPLVNKFVK